MLKIATTFCAVFIAASAFSISVEARPGFCQAQQFQFCRGQRCACERAVALIPEWLYYSGSYGDGSCYQPQRVRTPYGWSWQQVYVCGYNGYTYW